MQILPVYSSTLRADESSPVGASPGGCWLRAISTSLVLLPPEQLAQPLPGTVRVSVHTLHSSYWGDVATLYHHAPMHNYGIRPRFADISNKGTSNMAKETPSSSATSLTKKKQGLFEEDDEFEEFPTEGTYQN